MARYFNCFKYTKAIMLKGKAAQQQPCYFRPNRRYIALS